MVVYSGVLAEFDRPLKPAKPVWGEVRDRSTQVHAQRCRGGLNAG